MRNNPKCVDTLAVTSFDYGQSVDHFFKQCNKYRKQGDNMKVSEPGNSVYADDAGIWLDENGRTIHLTMEIGGQKGHVKVNFDRRMENGHPSLYRLLGKALQKVGIPIEAPNE